jgi:hypothetical protein
VFWHGHRAFRRRLDGDRGPVAGNSLSEPCDRTQHHRAGVREAHTHMPPAASQRGSGRAAVGATLKVRLPSPVTVVRDKECSRAMAVSQPMEHRQRSYEVFERKPDMECTTSRCRCTGMTGGTSPWTGRRVCWRLGARAWEISCQAGDKDTGRCSRVGPCVRHVLLPPCVLLWPWLWWRVQETIAESHEPIREPDDEFSSHLQCTACLMASHR